ncbi:MAG TPA: type I glyceraldehyde-3-phosphate dehydrogenase [Clostridiaceae bacterium]|nr:type I glyceraldehyde-3-phosphate dehydrogenase [Clostridiaceae bacterium]HBF77965.1 type I glyceraldehyde-3-phosphate dehydrogenase [Clostridiaceae bacterium]HBG38325.1 type I glyceraldehyde-3-phosphate dehydrogenase [Clostridiaceae bacterium]HBN27853.1 type I glyceraldehyde-3-phosphate dehydrogenase [Clostridiaceae bacterium]HBX49396.1 type I glyceraldehyde-3-phosphate dehydrogenase [Clostridiaceae bacterium]
MKAKIALNGFGRIGRTLTRITNERNSDDVTIAAINSKADTKTLAHLFKYDSTYGRFNGTVEYSDDSIIVNGKEIKVFFESDPSKLPYKKLGVDIAVDTTGLYTRREKAEAHLKAGAGKVIITAPAANEDITIVMGVNENEYNSNKHNIISSASCTTNCLAPLVKVIDERFGIVKGFMTTVHSYTNDQRVLDKTHKDLRRARAAALSIIPTTTGAAKTIGKVIPDLEGKLNGFSLRVPTPTVSIVDLVCEVKKSTSPEEVNGVLRESSENELKGILGYSDEPLVSADYIGDERSSIVDALSTMTIGGNMIKVVSWYDNEWGYTCRVYDLINYIAARL